MGAVRGGGMSVQVPKGYQQTEVGVIPSDWSLNRLVDLAEIRSGIAKNANANITNPVSVYYLRVANVQDGFLDLSEMSHLLVSRDDIKRYAVMPNDMLMNEGGDLDKLGRGALWNGEFSPCIHQNHVFVVRCGKFLLPTYLKAWTGSTAARRYFLLAGRQTTNLASINKTSLGLLPIPLPPNQAEQQAIAEALSDADALIESLEQLIAKKRQIKQGAMQELLTGQRRLQGFRGEWKVNRLGDLTQMCSGGTPPSSNPDFYNGQIPWVSISDMTSAGKYIASTEKKLTNEGFSSCAAKMFPSGTVLYAMYASLGECSIANVSLCTSQEILGIQPGEKIDGEYLYYYLQFIKNSVKNMGQQGTQANLNKGMVGDFLLKTPSLSEQKSIVEVLHEMDKEISNLELRLSKSQKIKQAMMQELLTGRIRLI